MDCLKELSVLFWVTSVFSSIISQSCYSQMSPCIDGEDPSSIEAHVQVLHRQYQKMQPDTAIFWDRMQQTFAWRQKEIADGMTVEATLKYPFLRTPVGVIAKFIFNYWSSESLQTHLNDSSHICNASEAS